MVIFLTFIIILITGIAAWRDYTFYQQWLRSGLIILSGLMLLGYLIQPNILPSDQTSKYALLTNETDFSTFSETDYDSIFSVRSHRIFVEKPAKNSSWLSSPSMLIRHLPVGSSVDIFGYGSEEPLPEEYHWVNHLTPPENGLTIISAPQQIEVGKDFSIKLKMISSAPEDSLTILKDGNLLPTAYPDSAGNIEIQDQLLAEGPAHYQFEWIREDTVLTENWNIRAVQPDRLTIGMLLYSPKFEMNYLAESLAERKHQMAVRTRIGQDRFRFDNLNSPDIQAENIASDPAAFDLLVLDAQEFQQLSEIDKNRIKQAIQIGLDLLLLPPSAENLQEWRNVFQNLTGQSIALNEVTRLEERRWSPEFVDSERSELNRIPLLNYDFEFPNEHRFMPLLRYQNRSPVAVRLNVQNGSVSTHLFFGSYQWLLNGQPDIYHRFWADYLGKLITLEKPFLNVTTVVPKVHRPVSITFTSTADLLTVRSLSGEDTFQIPFTDQENHPNTGTATFWPSQTGWHVAEHGENQTWFYVYEQDWSFDASYQTFMNTVGQLDHQQPPKDTGFQKPLKRAIPDWTWLILFLILQCVLWIERKVR